MQSDNVQTVSPWLDKLNYDWKSLESFGAVMHYKKGDTLYHIGDEVHSIFIVKSGRVRLFLTSYDGKEKAIAIMGENGLLGESNFYKSSTHISSAIAASPTIVIAVPKDVFKREVAKNQQYALQIIEIISWKVHLLSMHSLQLSFGTSLQRVCDAIIHLGLTYGIKTSKGYIKITITFTHQELADLIGTTRVTVATHIKDLTEQSIISKHGKHYVIYEMNRLSELLLN